MANYVCGQICIENYKLGSYGYHGIDLNANDIIGDPEVIFYEAKYYFNQTFNTNNK